MRNSNCTMGTRLHSAIQRLEDGKWLHRVFERGRSRRYGKGGWPAQCWSSRAMPPALLLTNRQGKSEAEHPRMRGECNNG